MFAENDGANSSPEKREFSRESFLPPSFSFSHGLPGRKLAPEAAVCCPFDFTPESSD